MKVVFGVDYSLKDRSSIAAIDAHNRKLLFNQYYEGGNWSKFSDIVRALNDEYKPIMINMDQGIGDSVNIENLQSWGLSIRPITITKVVKDVLMKQLLYDIEVRKISIGTSFDIYINLIRTLESEYNRETLLALALAWSGAKMLKDGWKIDFA